MTVRSAAQGRQSVPTGRLGGDATATLTSDGYMQDGSLNLRLQSVVLVSVPGWQLQLPREIACDTLQGETQKRRRSRPARWRHHARGRICSSTGVGLWPGKSLWRTVSQRALAGTSEEAYKPELDLLATVVRRRPDRRGEISFRLQGPLRQLRQGMRRVGKVIYFSPPQRRCGENTRGVHMTSNEIRSAFLRYSSSNNHRIVKSSPLIPKMTPHSCLPTPDGAV